MAGPTTTYTEKDIEIEVHGLTGQATVHGLDVNDPNVVAFINHCAVVQAQQHANIREAYKLIHSVSPTVFEDNKL